MSANNNNIVEDTSSTLYKTIFYTATADPEKWNCNLCPEGSKPKKGGGTSGCMNLKSHVQSKHSNVNLAKIIQDHHDSVAVKDNGGNTCSKYFTATPAAANTYKWMDWIVTDDLPLIVVEKKTYRKYSSLQSISYKTLLKYMLRTENIVVEAIKRELPSNFGIIFDGT